MVLKLKSMDSLSLYSDLLGLFMALIVAGMGLKLALQKPNNQTYQIGDKQISKQKAHTAAALALMGVVIQLVSNTMKVLDGRSLLFDEKILAAYAFALMVMIMKK